MPLPDSMLTILKSNVSVLLHVIRRRVTQRILTRQPIDLLLVNQEVRPVQGPVVDGHSIISHRLRVEAGPVSDDVPPFVHFVERVHRGAFRQSRAGFCIW